VISAFLKEGNVLGECEYELILAFGGSYLRIVHNYFSGSLKFENEAGETWFGADASDCCFDIFRLADR
jgi:hypothetical protein